MSDILIIKSKWLDKIFRNGKCLEIRGSNTSKRGRIELAESGSSLIRGYCDLVRTFPINNEKEWKRFKSLHQVDISYEELLKRYKKPYAWVLDNKVEYDKPIKYSHPKGAVIWVKGNDERKKYE